MNGRSWAKGSRPAPHLSLIPFITGSTYGLLVVYLSALAGLLMIYEDSDANAADC
jgi:hypothetical protein